MKTTTLANGSTIFVHTFSNEGSEYTATVTLLEGLLPIPSIRLEIKCDELSILYLTLPILHCLNLWKLLAMALPQTFTHSQTKEENNVCSNEPIYCGRLPET